jgi:gamma-glutamylcyclotransferase (GGCT)/AIG2-like uncharacterized protein YtfP
MTLVFVYGTLRADAPNSKRTPAVIARAFKEAKLIGRGTVSGTLHWVSWYPGLAEGRGARVVGDVFDFGDNPGFLTALDRYEDASTDPAADPEYLRKRKLVTLRNGDKLYAWTYVYNHARNLGRRIESGDFLSELTHA